MIAKNLDYTKSALADLRLLRNRLENILDDRLHVTYEEEVYLEEAVDDIRSLIANLHMATIIAEDNISHPDR